MYNRKAAIDYAKKWAYLRNHDYLNFDNLGGDCTNFVSQCIFCGSNIMNYDKNGWYYIDGNSKSPSWTGVEFLNNFLVNNKKTGPYAKNSNIEEIELGDIIQLSFDGQIFPHTVIVVDKISNNLNNIFTSSHTYDTYYKQLSTYTYNKIRFIHIEGVRK